ncbi:coiled-coil domain-containing protein 187 [Phyllostomus hastatus]|uniref:coiled-coil domain-containing protein 187 n=1 Tax=Phyllostomus hastatus TaxID=9423 RepID=UPI001E681F22|nr:coiled-coil domain-containing protein 187 [Phyllostomus hastatus]
MRPPAAVGVLRARVSTAKTLPLGLISRDSPTCGDLPRACTVTECSLASGLVGTPLSCGLGLRAAEPGRHADPEPGTHDPPVLLPGRHANSKDWGRFAGSEFFRSTRVDPSTFRPPRLLASRDLGGLWGLPEERGEPGSRASSTRGGRSRRSTTSTRTLRADGPRSSAAKKGLAAALRRPGPCEQPGAPRGAPFVAWSDHLERPGALGKAGCYPLWTAGKEGKDGDSSVSSGRLSGSSGGHESCAPPHGLWTERPPQVLGCPRLHRDSSPRLEQLRDKIRAQVRWQGSCASLGTSMPSSASHLHKASMPAPRQKVQKLKKAPAAPAYPVPRENPKSMKSCSCKREKPSAWCARKAAKDRESELVGAHAWRKGQALARGLLGPPPALPRLRSTAASGETAHPAEPGDTEKAGAAKSHPVRPRTPSPAATRRHPQVPPSSPLQAPCNPAVTIQSALAILQDLRRQIQAGLELARGHQLRRGCEQRPSPWCRQEPAGRRPRDPCGAPDPRSSFSESPWVPTRGTPSSSERAGGVPAGQRWRTLARWESYPQRTWWTPGQDAAFQRPGSPRERLGCFPQRPWSASAGRRAWATRDGWEAPARGPRSPLEGPSPASQRPWSASLTKWAGSPCKGAPLPPSGAKEAWLGPAQSTLQMAPRKDSEAPPPPLPCPKTRGLLGRPYSPASLREFMHQKALARRQQALEEKASAVRALERRNQRLQDVYRKQREAVLGKAGPVKAGPVVSQTNPSIVTFVPHAAQCRDQEAPGSLGSPVMQWSKVTSGMVLGDQEAPGSFCLCLNGALDGAEPLDTAGPPEGWQGTPLWRSASPALGPPGLRDLAAQHPCPGLCIYLDPEEAQRLGTPGPLHFRYKQARLQALETMANILKQRIDLLTAKLLGSEAADAPGGLASDPPPLCPGTAAPAPATPACPRALVPDGGRGAPWDVPARLLPSPASFPDGEALLWSPGRPRGLVEDSCSELDKRLARNMASFQALRPLAGSSPGAPAPPDPTCGSLWLEETPPPPPPWAGGAGSATPWTSRSCGKGEPAGWLVGAPGAPGGDPLHGLALRRGSLPDNMGLGQALPPTGLLPALRASVSCVGISLVAPGPRECEGLAVIVAPAPGQCLSRVGGRRGYLLKDERPPGRRAPTGDTDSHERAQRRPTEPSGKREVFYPVGSPTRQPPGQPGQPRPRHVADIRQRSLRFLQSLERHQQTREQALALLRQRAELEVWETQRALDELLLKHRLERLMGNHAALSRPGAASEPEGLQVCGDPDLKTSQSAVTAGLRSQPVLGGDAAVPSRGSEEGQGRQDGQPASAEPAEEGRPDQGLSPLLLARLYPGDSPIHQMLQQSLREQELHAQYLAALLRLREKALEEKTCSELAWLEHRRRCLGSEGGVAVLAALAERQRQALGDLEREQREIRSLRRSPLSSRHDERTLLLQHHRDILSVQKSLARLQRELQATPWLLQSSGPDVPAARDGDSETSQPPEGPVWGASHPPTPHRPGSPGSHRPCGSTESLSALALHPTPCHLLQQWPHLWAVGPAGSCWVGRGQPGPAFLCPCTRHLATDHSCPLDVTRVPLVESCGWGRTLQEGAAWGGSHRPSTLPCSLVTEQQDRTSSGATSAVDGHLQPRRPAWGQETPTADGWPSTQGGPVESGSHTGQGDAQPDPCPWPAAPETQALTEGHAQSFRGRSPHPPGGEGPCSPQDAGVAEGRAGAASGLDSAGSPEGAAPTVESQRPEQQRTETYQQEDPHGPSSWQEAAQLTTCPAPAAAEEATPPTQHQGSALPQLPAPSGTCSGSSAGSRSSSPESGPSCPSLQEFQKVSAFLVQLSESSTSPSDWEAGDSPDADLGWSGGSSPRDSGGLHGDGRQETWEGPAGRGTSPLHRPSTVSGSPESEPGPWQRGWTPLPPRVPSPGAGSELSEASSEVWDEDSLREPGAGVQPAAGRASPAGGSGDLEDGGAPRTPLLSLGPGGGQEASGTSGSRTRGSDTGKAGRTPPEAARTAFPSDPNSCSDLDLSLSLPSGSSASKEADVSEGLEPGPPQASLGCPEGPWAAGLRAPAADRKPPECPPGAARLPAALRAGSGAPGQAGSGAAPALEEAPPPSAGRVLREILSPVDDVLSYGSTDLPSSTRRDVPLPALPPAPPAELRATPSPRSEDFPSPPEDALCPGGSLSPPEEGTSINTCELSSLSEEGPPEGPSLGPQEASLCLGAGGRGGNLGDQLGESSSTGGNQAVGGRWPEPFSWLGSPSWGGAGDAPDGIPGLTVQHPTLPRVDCVAGGALPTPWAAGNPGLPGTWRGDPAPALDAGPCAGPPGVDRTQVVDLVSTELTRRILCDTLAALSERAAPGRPPTGERAGASRVARPPTAGPGSVGEDGTSEERADVLR